MACGFISKFIRPLDGYTETVRCHIIRSMLRWQAGSPETLINKHLALQGSNLQGISMYAPQGHPAVYFSVLASSVIIVAARSCLLPPCVVPALGLRLIIQSVNEMPPAQIDGIVQGVYFALKRRGLNKIKVLPSFWFLRAKTRENGAFYGSRPAGNAGKSIGFIVSDR